MESTLHILKQSWKNLSNNRIYITFIEQNYELPNDIDNFKQKLVRNKLLILSFTLLLFACNSQTVKKSAITNAADSVTVTLINYKSERFFPEKKGTEKFDTLIANRQLQITIKKTVLDSFVTNEYEEDGIKHIDKYRDSEISLTINQNSQKLLDTVFRKKQFSKYGDKGFMDIAIFHNYWFNKLSKDRIEFLGVISKPETDYTLDFYHYFDLTNKKLNFVEHTDDE